MKSLLVIAALLCLCVGCTQQDAIDTWTKNIYPSTNTTYDIGSPALQYQDGYFVNVWASNNITATNNISATYFIGNGSYLTGSWSLGNFSNVNILSGGHLWVWDADNSDNFHLSHDGGVGIIENPTGSIYVRGDDNVVVDLTGDSAGMWEFQVENSNNHEVASIDTDGNLDVEGYLANGNASIRADGTIVPVSMANASAPNNSIFYSTGSNTLCYKDVAGNVHSLY